jgi:hypothetical protein
MTDPVCVQIIGARVACAEGVKETWRDVAAWAAGQLAARYMEAWCGWITWTCLTRLARPCRRTRSCPWSW